MNLIRAILLLVLATLGHAVGVQLGPWFAAAADLFLVATVLFSLNGSVLPALLMGTAAGWLYDSLSDGPFGLFGTADVLTAYFVVVVVQRLVIERPVAVFFTAATAALVQQIVVMGLTVLFAPEMGWPNVAWWPIKMFTTGLLVVLARTVGARLAHRIGEGRRRRSSRLRFD